MANLPTIKKKQHQINKYQPKNYTKPNIVKTILKKYFLQKLNLKKKTIITHRQSILLNKPHKNNNNLN